MSNYLFLNFSPFKTENFHQDYSNFLENVAKYFEIIILKFKTNIINIQIDIKHLYQNFVTASTWMMRKKILIEFHTLLYTEFYEKQSNEYPENWTCYFTAFL